jgi:hypothetical protein
MQHAMYFLFAINRRSQPQGTRNFTTTTILNTNTY